MAKKTKKTEDEAIKVVAKYDNPDEVVAICDHPEEVIANCENPQLAVANRDHKSVDIKSMIRNIRGQQVMLDFELAMLYGVETKVLNQAVKRNINRFPDDFMFQLTKNELESLRSQFVTSNSRDNQQDTNWKSQFVTSNLSTNGGMLGESRGESRDFFDPLKMAESITDLRSHESTDSRDNRLGKNVIEIK